MSALDIDLRSIPKFVGAVSVAYELACEDIAVFKVNPNTKRPTTKDWDGTSSADIEIAVDMFWRTPNAGVAIDCRKSGFIIIDLDRHPGQPDGVDAFDSIVSPDVDWQAIPTIETPGNGFHLYFRQPEGEEFGNSKGSLPAGIDVRGAGGYVVAPGTKKLDGSGWNYFDGSPPIWDAPPLPEWLATYLRKTEKKSEAQPRAEPGRRERAYAQAALERIASELSGIREGSRNITLNTAALKLGHLVASGWLNQSEAETALIESCKANGSWGENRAECEATIASGMTEGMKSPHAPLPGRKSRGDGAASLPEHLTIVDPETGEVMPDFDAAKNAIADAGADAAAEVLCTIVLTGAFSPVEEKKLTSLAGKITGAGERVVAAMLKERRRQARAEKAAEVRRINAANSTKKRLTAPAADSEAAPIMELWDDVLSSIGSIEPPMRDINGKPVNITCREPSGMHGLSSDGSNSDDAPTSRLPAPKMHLLTQHDAYSVEIEISDYITFLEETEDGERAVCPPRRLVEHWLRYSRSNLPKVNAVITMPLVLPNGEMLAKPGLNREHGIVMRAEPALAAYIPRREECGSDAIRKAFRFLTEEWLCDLATNCEGKAVMLAYVASIIERVLFPERPAFFVTAGQRSSGKTTSIHMAILAATGVRPPAAAWARDEEERRKALLAYLMQGVPTLVWDNIQRGTTISSAVIDACLTTEVFRDRILGSTTHVDAPAYTIQAWTGNNIFPKGDFASRILQVRLNVDQPDPQNRSFRHSDPIAWTLNHRGEILRAIYIILLGNPQLDPSRRVEPRTRFKSWWNLVGSAIEHAAAFDQFPGDAPVSFPDMFDAREADDEEGATVGEVLEALRTQWPASERFYASDVADFLGKQLADDEDATALRQFCALPHSNVCSTKSIGRKLTAIVDTPTRTEHGVLTLKVTGTVRRNKVYAVKFTEG